MRKEHIVPLPAQAVSIFATLQPLTSHQQYVFLSGKQNRRGDKAAPMSEAAFGIALKKLGYEGKQHPHGFRVTASTLLHERGNSSELIETQLAHTRPGVWGVYNKAHLLPQRKAMVTAWADYLDGLRKQAEEQTALPAMAYEQACERFAAFAQEQATEIARDLLKRMTNGSACGTGAA